MIVYLKNMARYKIQHFKGMTYDQVRPIFEREYNHVQTFLKSDKDEEPSKKRAAKETLLQESFKKLRVEVEVSGSHSTQQQETPTVDPVEISEEDVQNMLQIVLMAEFKVEALQVNFEDMLKDFDREDLDAVWRITKEKFSTTMPTQNKEKDLWAELTRLYEPNADDVFYLELMLFKTSRKYAKGLLLLVEELVLLVQINAVRRKVMLLLKRSRNYSKVERMMVE
nr:hypothetical protein [Tanacetum cinerariifolium]